MGGDPWCVAYTHPLRHAVAMFSVVAFFSPAAPAFNYLRTIEDRNERVVDQTGIEPVTS